VLRRAASWRSFAASKAAATTLVSWATAALTSAVEADLTTEQQNGIGT
jgi:hypothetical protein